ncbi:MAG TPA: hypothetical protein PKI46_04930, partial [Bacteroidales bacterium]|nr:hypothetical protein [Bacteroidales bacterium]
NRITTMVVTMPRIILAEFNTHRMFSRNSASSRAIPFEKMVKSVEENPFIPIAWQKDHKGMQGSEYYTDENSIMLIRNNWLSARNNAIKVAKMLNEKAVTKQLCNRLLEPFMWHTVIVTATEWENFFALRCPKYALRNYPEPDGIEQYYRSKKDCLKASNSHGEGMVQLKDNLTELQWLQINKGQAEIHMMALAEAMWDALNESTPKELNAGEWHIPFGDSIDYSKFYKIIDLESTQEKTPQEVAVIVSTAMCARVSYTVVGEEDKEPNYENDIKLHDRLAASGHWSPFEHCAKTMTCKLDMMENDKYLESSDGWSGNFRGFIQYRKTFENENITTS